MAGKKANGEGNILQRADGRWMARLTLPDGTLLRDQLDREPLKSQTIWKLDTGSIHELLLRSDR